MAKYAGDEGQSLPISILMSQIGPLVHMYR